MKHDGGWQTKEFVYPMKRLVYGDSYAKCYKHSKGQFLICYLLSYVTAHEAIFRLKVT